MSISVRAGPRCCLQMRRGRPLRCSMPASAPPGALGVPPLPSPAGPRSRFEVVCPHPLAWSSSVTPSVWVRPFATGVAATMASADSSRFAVAAGGPATVAPLRGRPAPLRSFPAREASRGKAHTFPLIRLPHLRPRPPCSYWASACVAASPAASA